MATIDFIKNLAVGDNIKAQDEINSVLSQMALDAVSSLKQEVAQNYFSGVQEESEQLEEKAGCTAKSAAAGKDIGKKGKNFTKIAKKAAEEYGSEESGKKVAGAILKKLRKEDVESLEEGTDNDSSPLNQYKRKNVKGLYNYTHYEHPNGSYVQIRHGDEFHGTYTHNNGQSKDFNNLNDLKKYVKSVHTKPSED